MTEIKINPFLKWAGGKRWLVNRLDRPKLPVMRRYIEPFFGGGAMFFALRPARSLVSDINGELINLYRCMRDYPDDLLSLLEGHQEKHCDAYYYCVRESVPSLPLEQAARTLYLNRSCWNGLYRVNLKGEFNVPRGTKDRIVVETDDFKAYATALRSAEIEHCDFEQSINKAGNGDFIFADPPYTVKHNYNGFVKYNEKIFSWADQERLAAALMQAKKKGAHIMLTNADHPSVSELFKELGHATSVSRHSVLSSEVEKRVATTERVFSTFSPAWEGR